jgi:hypothetical protein
MLAKAARYNAARENVAKYWGMLAAGVRYEETQQTVAKYWRRKKRKAKNAFWTSVSILIPLVFISLCLYLLY